MVIPRRLLALGLAALILAGAGIAVAATRDNSEETAAQAPPTTTEQPADTTSSTVPDTTTTVPVIVTSTPPSSSVTSTPTTARRGRVTTTVPRVTTTRPPGSPTTTTGAVPFCKPANIEVTVTTDRPSYTAGQEVTMTSRLRNKSAETCFYNGYAFTSAFKHEDGRTIVGQSVIADSFADVPLRPGQTITHSGAWDQRLCSEPACGRAPAGPYTAAATWNFAASTYEVWTTFNVV